MYLSFASQRCQNAKKGKEINCMYIAPHIHLCRDSCPCYHAVHCKGNMCCILIHYIIVQLHCIFIPPQFGCSTI